jgi:hypothetical protein
LDSFLAFDIELVLLVLLYKFVLYSTVLVKLMMMKEKYGVVSKSARAPLSLHLTLLPLSHDSGEPPP